MVPLRPINPTALIAFVAVAPAHPFKVTLPLCERHDFTATGIVGGAIELSGHGQIIDTVRGRLGLRAASRTVMGKSWTRLPVLVRWRAQDLRSPLAARRASHS